jgi:hypothetical protein
MRDLGDVNYLLKMEIKRDIENKITTISQKKYVCDLLKKYNMENSKGVDTPQIVGNKLYPETGMSAQEIADQPFDYRGVVGSLLYLARTTRPDISNAIRELSRFLSCYNKSHWEAARRVLKYLKQTSNYGLYIDGNINQLSYEVYTDASFACQEKERISVTGYCVMLAGVCISWSSSRQKCVAVSTTESELIALSEGVKESEWFGQLLSELGFKQTEPIIIRCDSKSAIAVVQNPGNHNSTKHVEIRFLFTRDLVEKGKIKVVYCHTLEMLADLLTKALSGPQFEILRFQLGVRELD